MKRCIVYFPFDLHDTQNPIGIVLSNFSFLEILSVPTTSTNSGSQNVVQGPRGFTRPLQGIYKIKTMFIIILRNYLLF